MPVNRRIYELIVEGADLLIENEMPAVLLQCCANAVTYEVTIKAWELGDFSEHLSLIAYPTKNLREYAGASFRALKREQSKLVRHQT
jgi:hypothetical protein